MKKSIVALGWAGVIGLGTYTCATPALAACEAVPSIERQYRKIARDHFSALLPHLPALLGCDSASDFPPGVLGEFSSDTWQIRVLLHSNAMPLEITLAHELGHALAHKNGEVHGRFRGHGKVWLQTMIRAGYAGEAERTANLHHHYPGLLAVYQGVAKGESMHRRWPAEIDVIALLRSKPSWLASLTAPID